MRFSSQPTISFGVASPAAIFLHHRHIGIWCFADKGAVVLFHEQPHRQEGGSLVAVGKRMVSCQMLDQDGSLFDQIRIGVLISETGLRRSQGGIGKRDSRQASDLFSARSE